MTNTTEPITGLQRQQGRFLALRGRRASEAGRRSCLGLDFVQRRGLALGRLGAAAERV